MVNKYIYEIRRLIVWVCTDWGDS